MLCPIVLCISCDRNLCILIFLCTHILSHYFGVVKEMTLVQWPWSAQMEMEMLSESTARFGRFCPTIECPRGFGPCLVKISRTTINPRRYYYACLRDEAAKKCTFFKWCDQL